MEQFKSKADVWLILFLVVIFGAVLINLAYDQKWIGFVFILFVVAFILHVFLNTYYIIENDKLTIKCGFFINLKIEIQSIKKITKSYNVISSPALSFDRIEIVYNQFDTVLISPKDRLRFIEAIKSVNPQIEINI
ncbi:PH domain-containing protein [Flavobacterium sp. AC]|uniref:PH domain-containing protein n=1 Tax=Flavobacterium azizsancarii TaxID=2961580 RepID=A0ABT4WBZ2_9FLAO|nr:PH domain-containing protein [Flavobacterium azizsancarii]MDA6069987.1 PH domain-containing protein [Flavobacterium azizsancarii]